MTDLLDVATELRTILGALPDVDTSSISDYEPILTTQKVGLLVVPFEQSGMMEYAGTGKHSFVHAHRLVCEFWVKVNNKNVEPSIQRGRDICLQAMRLLAANPTLNGTVMKLGSASLGNASMIGQYDVLPRYEDRGHIPYIIARLFIPVEIREVAQW